MKSKPIMRWMFHFLSVGSLAFLMLVGSQTLIQTVACAATEKPIKLTFVSQWPKGHTFGKIALAANDGWIAANLKPLCIGAYSQIVIKYAFFENHIHFAHFG